MKVIVTEVQDGINAGVVLCVSSGLGFVVGGYSGGITLSLVRLMELVFHVYKYILRVLMVAILRVL